MKRATWLVHLVGLAAAWFLCLTPGQASRAPVSAVQEEGAATPQALILRLAKAYRASHWADLFALLRPSTRPLAVAQLLSTLERMQASVQQQREESKRHGWPMEQEPVALEALRREFQLPALEAAGLNEWPETEGEREAYLHRASKVFAHAVLPKLWGKMMRIAGEVVSGDRPPVRIASDLVIFGDTASVTVSGVPMTMCRVDGRWYVDALLDEK